MVEGIKIHELTPGNGSANLVANDRFVFDHNSSGVLWETRQVSYQKLIQEISNEIGNNIIIDGGPPSAGGSVPPQEGDLYFDYINNELYVYVCSPPGSGSNCGWELISGSGGLASGVIINVGEPSTDNNDSPITNGDVWWDPDTKNLYVRFNGQWEILNPPPVITSSIEPTNNNAGGPVREGDQWFDTDNNLLYIYHNSTWTPINASGGGGIIVGPNPPCQDNDGNLIGEGDIWYDNVNNNILIFICTDPTQCSDLDCWKTIVDVDGVPVLGIMDGDAINAQPKGTGDVASGEVTVSVRYDENRGLDLDGASNELFINLDSNGGLGFGPDGGIGINLNGTDDGLGSLGENEIIIGQPDGSLGTGNIGDLLGNGSGIKFETDNNIITISLIDGTSADDILVWNGTEWVISGVSDIIPDVFGGKGITTSKDDDLTVIDVDISSASGLEFTNDASGQLQVNTGDALGIDNVGGDLNVLYDQTRGLDLDGASNELFVNLDPNGGLGFGPDGGIGINLNGTDDGLGSLGENEIIIGQPDGSLGTGNIDDLLLGGKGITTSKDDDLTVIDVDISSASGLEFTNDASGQLQVNTGDALGIDNVGGDLNVLYDQTRGLDLDGASNELFVNLDPNGGLGFGPDGGIGINLNGTDDGLGSLGENEIIIGQPDGSLGTGNIDDLLLGGDGIELVINNNIVTIKADVGDGLIINSGQIEVHENWLDGKVNEFAGDGEINFNAGDGLSSVGDNATANQDIGTTKTFSVNVTEDPLYQGIFIDRNNSLDVAVHEAPQDDMVYLRFNGEWIGWDELSASCGNATGEEIYIVGDDGVDKIQGDGGSIEGDALLYESDIDDNVNTLGVITDIDAGNGVSVTPGCSTTIALNPNNFTFDNQGRITGIVMYDAGADANVTVSVNNGLIEIT